MCLFCKIVKNEIPSSKVYEDNKVLAFMDIAPINPGHVLVVPKDHYANMEEIPEDLLASVMFVVKKIGKAMKSGLGIEAYNIQENNDPIAGQIIPHIHFHIIPRYKNDKLKLWPGKKYNDGEIDKVVEKIKNELN
ncbi:HIT domain-containing protein [Candidatus Parcubacteria bacterium]|nr:HIT domain-containing protein [Candidatus Parcubacteria bacterium]